MKNYHEIFIVFLGVLVCIYFFAPVKAPKEYFENPLNPVPTIKIPSNVVKEAILLKESPVGAFELPGEIPGGPYEQIAKNSPQVYKDPSLIKTTRQRIKNTLETLKGFLAFQAQEIENRSDPTIQLPLTTARSDFKRLSASVNVLQRNPGLTPEQTEQQMDEIEDNLAYLQREVELIGVNRPFQSPVHDLDLEGFDNPSSSGSSGSPAPNDPATLQELTDFSARIQGEILRLSASGTTDPLVIARVGNLTKMKTTVDDIVFKLQTGAMLAPEVPITSGTVQKALPILGKMDEPLPQVLRSLNLPAGLANMLPANLDANSQQQINQLIDKYGEEFIKGVSAKASISFEYTPAGLQGINANQAQGQTLSSAQQAPAPLQQQPSDPTDVSNTGFPNTGNLQNVSKEYWPERRGMGERFPVFPTAKYDWRTKVFDITNAIRRRGMNVKDLGGFTVDELGNVSKDFSWKGYAQMICKRLGTVDEYGSDVACGCPPDTWWANN